MSPLVPVSPALPIVIAVDGPAASGKGTVARALARHFGLPHLDTGLLYRAVGHAMLLAGEDLANGAAAAARAAALVPAQIHPPTLRGEAAGAAASVISAHPGVRAALLAQQQMFARDRAGAVLDGRDIGTVIAPDAAAKLFVTADPVVRARRRHAETGGAVPFEAVLADIAARDTRDRDRAAAPLMRAADADLLDTSGFSIAAAVERAIALVEARVRRPVR